MKLLRLLFLVLITVFMLPQAEEGEGYVHPSADSLSSSVSITQYVLKHTPYFRATIKKLKRRPVALNDSHNEECAVFSFNIPARFIYVDNIRSGYHCNPYLSVPTPLRSWRGPPTA